MFKRKKGNKYNAKKIEVGGIIFDSKREAERWLFLKEAEEKGLISNLKRQVPFELIPKITEKVVKHLKTKDKIEERTVQLATVYVADFYYEKDFQFVVEDLKISPKLIPADFRLKEKLFRYKYGYSIKRVYKPTEPI